MQFSDQARRALSRWPITADDIVGFIKDADPDAVLHFSGRNVSSQLFEYQPNATPFIIVTDVDPERVPNTVIEACIPSPEITHVPDNPVESLAAIAKRYGEEFEFAGRPLKFVLMNSADVDVERLGLDAFPELPAEVLHLNLFKFYPPQRCEVRMSCLIRDLARAGD